VSVSSLASAGGNDELLLFAPIVLVASRQRKENNRDDNCQLAESFETAHWYCSLMHYPSILTATKRRWKPDALLMERSDA
jgi:hypothetical protein